MKFNIDQRNKMIAEMVTNIDWSETYDKWLSTRENKPTDLSTPKELMVWVIIHADRFLSTANESTIYTTCNGIRIEICEDEDPYLYFCIEVLPKYNEEL